MIPMLLHSGKGMKGMNYWYMQQYLWILTALCQAETPDKGYYCIILIIKGKQGTFGSEGNTLHLDCGGSHTILYVCQTALLHTLKGNFTAYKIYSLSFIYLNF